MNYRQEFPNVVSLCSDEFIDKVNFLFDMNALQTDKLGETAVVRIRSTRFRPSWSVDVCFVRCDRQWV